MEYCLYLSYWSLHWNKKIQQNQNLFSLQKLFSFMKTCQILFNTYHQSTNFDDQENGNCNYVVVQVEPSFLPNAIEEINSMYLISKLLDRVLPALIRHANVGFVFLIMPQKFDEISHLSFYSKYEILSNFCGLFWKITFKSIYIRYHLRIF